MIPVSRSAYDKGYAPGLYIMMGIMAVLIMAVPILPFIGRKDDVPFWNFTIRSAVTVAAALFISGILCGGLCLLLLSLAILSD